MRFEVFNRGLLGKTDVVAVDMIHYSGMYGLCFSHHHPHNNNPRYAADTSTEGVLRYLGAQRAGTTEMCCSELDKMVVTTHHFDADAFLPVWSLLNPEVALENADLLRRIARCGDFFIHGDEESSRLNAAIESLHLRLRGAGKRGERLVNDSLTR
ncbi:MAG TPA: DUF6687 family protein, partial [Chthonomonadales bacterium]|nr:DUF6687 family protein [Chthonomonadales bacterium]